MQKTTSIIARLFILGAWLFGCSAALAKDEHSHFRRLHTRLHDTTEIDYEIGAIAIWHQGTLRSIAFQPNPKTNDGFLRTLPFTVAAASDTLSFCRFVILSDRGQQHNHFTDSTLPTGLGFDEFSSAKYIIELRTANGKELLAAIDTIQVYRNGTGELRWFSTTEPTCDYHKALPTAAIGKPVLLSVREILQLPFWGKVTKTSRDDLPNANPCDSGSYTRRDQDYPSPPQPIVAPAPINPASPFVYIFPNPSVGRSNVQIQCKTSGTLVLDIVSNDGEPMKRLKQQVPAGTKTIDLKFNTLPIGQYFLRIADGPAVYTFPLSLVK